VRSVEIEECNAFQVRGLKQRGQIKLTAMYQRPGVQQAGKPQAAPAGSYSAGGGGQYQAHGGTRGGQLRPGVPWSGAQRISASGFKVRHPFAVKSCDASSPRPLCCANLGILVQWLLEGFLGEREAPSARMRALPACAAESCA
jgi:hypothetical protein